MNKSTVDLRNIEAEIKAAQYRTGRDVDSIVADLVAADVYIGDLNRAIEAIPARAEADAAQTRAAVMRVAVSARPQVLQAAGVAVRRTDPEGEAKRLLEGCLARLRDLLEAKKRHCAISDDVDQLREALYLEANRAGLSTDEAKARMRNSTYTRGTYASDKAAA
jgi:hypothetical protein